MKITSYDFIIDVIKQNTNDCVLWPFSVDHKGYGGLSRNKKTLKAHRLALTLSKGEAKDHSKTFACHTCHNRSCINPNHLYWGSPQDNTNDMIKNGTNHSKLTNEDVIYIRQNNIDAKTIANRFDVHISTIYSCRNKKYYKHIK